MFSKFLYVVIFVFEIATLVSSLFKRDQSMYERAKPTLGRLYCKSSSMLVFMV